MTPEVLPQHTGCCSEGSYVLQCKTCSYPPRFRRPQDPSLSPSSLDVLECSETGTQIAQGYGCCL